MKKAKKLNPKFFKHLWRMKRQDKMFGMVTVGERGQVVIPAEARNEFDLKPGDQLVVIGKFGKIISFMKADSVGEFMEMILGEVSGSGFEDKVREHFKKINDSLSKSKSK